MCVQNIRGRSRRPSPFLLKDHSWFNSTIKVSGPVGAALPPFSSRLALIFLNCLTSSPVIKMRAAPWWIVNSSPLTSLLV